MTKESVYELIHSESIDDFLLGMRILWEYYPGEIIFESNSQCIPISIYRKLKGCKDKKIQSFWKFKKEMSWKNSDMKIDPNY